MMLSFLFDFCAVTAVMIVVAVTGRVPRIVRMIVVVVGTNNRMVEILGVVVAKTPLGFFHDASAAAATAAEQWYHDGYSCCSSR